MRRAGRKWAGGRGEEAWAGAGLRACVVCACVHYTEVSAGLCGSKLSPCPLPWEDRQGGPQGREVAPGQPLPAH